MVDSVSVTSTMASHSPDTALASVAPQEKVMSTRMPRSAKNRRVTLTSSVAMRLPSSCSMRVMFESPGTAITQRVGFLLTLEYTRSATTSTSESFSSVQSLPVIPASSMPPSM